MYDRSIGTREDCVQEAASFASKHFRTRGSDSRVRPAGRRHDKGPPAGSCKFLRFYRKKKLKNVSFEYHTTRQLKV